jgi:NAD(P)-dependent dehydrogenase (short-subunit alcohol dehydrogenase family)
MHVVITGSGQGIGKAIAIDLSENQSVNRITLVSRSSNVENTLKCIKNLGHDNLEVEAYIIDISKTNELVKLKEYFDLFSPSALVNSAAILGKSAKFDEITDIDLVKTFEVNTAGSFNMIKLMMPFFKIQKFGRIINFGGGGAAYPYSNFLPYALSKVSVIRMTETIAQELEEDGFTNILINSIAPGAVKTQMLEEVKKNGGEVKTTVDVLEPVKLVRFLLFNDNRKINGKFVHSRDNYNNASIFNNSDSFTLRRI